MEAVTKGGAYAMKNRRLLIVFIVLILIIVLELVMLSRCGRPSEPDAPEPLLTPTPTMDTSTPVPTPTLTPAPTIPPATDAPPVITPAPTQEPTPTPSPTPTATPAPTPTPSYGTVIGQGSFSSDTGTSLNMNVEWVAYDDGSGNAVIAVTGTLSSYSLQLATLYDAATIQLGDYSSVCNTRSANIGDDSARVTSPLFYTKLTVPMGTSGDMSVSFRYGGTYSGTALPTIDASGYVYTN